MINEPQGNCCNWCPFFDGLIANHFLQACSSSSLASGSMWRKANARKRPLAKQPTMLMTLLFCPKLVQMQGRYPKKPISTSTTSAATTLISIKIIIGEDRMKILLLAVILVLCVGRPINTDLPPLLRYEMEYPAQNFTVKNKENFKYQFEASGSPQVTILDTEGKPINTSTCSFVPSQIDLELQTQLNLHNSDNSNWSYMKTSLVVVKFQSLIYTIDNNLQLTAFSYSETQIHKIASITLPSPKDLNLDNRVNFALSNDQTLLFLFSTNGAWVIETRGILTKIQKIDLTFDFTVYSSEHVGDWLLLTTMTNGIVIYDISTKRPQHLGSISLFQNTTIYPIDLKFDTKRSLLFVLDNIKNIYIFRISEKLVYFYDVVEMQHYSNFRLEVEDARIYYSFVEGNTVQIGELYYNETKKQADLVRYYKDFDYVNDFVVTKDQLLVLSHEILDVYPAFVDPRMISTPHNGVRMQLTARRLFPLSLSSYLFSTPQSLKIMKILTTPSHMSCNFRNTKQSLTISYKANLSSCDSIPSSLSKSSNSYCEVSKLIHISIDVPEESERRRVMMYALVIMVGMFFVAGLICLVQWRNGRLDVIDKLAEEIQRHKEKEKRARQFVEENEVEFPSNVFSQG